MKRIIFLLLLSLILVACGTEPPRVSDIESPPPSSGTNLPKAKTPTPTRASTSLPVLGPSSTPSPLPTSTPFATPIITPTYTPTPSIIDTNTVNDLSKIDSFGQGTISSVAISPNKQALVVAGSQGVWQYDLPTLDLSDHQFGEGEWINALSWSSDGARLAAGGSKGIIYIKNTLDDEDFFVLDDRLEGVVQLSWSPDSHLLASVWSDNSIDIWNITNRTKVQSLKHLNLSYVGQVDWSPDSSKIASVGGNGMLQIWDITTGNNTFSFEGKVEEVVGEGWLPNGIRSVSWSPDGQWIAVGHESGTILTINIDEGTEALELHHHSSSVEDLQWSDDSTRLLSADWDGSIYLLDVNSGNIVAFENQGAGILGLIYLSSDQQFISWGADGTVKLWNETQSDDGQILAQHSPAYRSVAWSPKGSELAVGGDDAIVRIINSEDGQIIRVLEGHDGQIYALAWSPDGNMLASGDLSGNINIWNPATGDNVLALESDSVSGLTWSPDGNKIAVASYAGSVMAWSIPDGEVLWSKGANTPLSIAWSPNDDKVIVGTFGRVLNVLNSTNGELLYSRNEQPSGGVYSVAWNPDGSEFVSGGVDTIYLWDNDNGRLSGYLQGHEEGHFNVIKGVAYSPDGSLLASGAYDGTIHLWDPSTGESIKTLLGHHGNVEGVAWSPDGINLASIGSDGNIIIWGLDAEPVIENKLTDDSILDDSDFPLPIPSGEPDATYNEIPIMAQAIAGDEDELSYYYIVEASLENVQDFYMVEMENSGWNYEGSGELEEGMLLQIFHLFQQGDEIASITIYSLDNNLSYVVLAQWSNK